MAFLFGGPSECVRACARVCGVVGATSVIFYSRPPRPTRPRPDKFPPPLVADGTMVLWVDKHRPKSLKDLDFHKPLSAQLGRMVEGSGDFPHTLVYGPSGAGKKTRIMALLRELHGPSVERLRVEQRSFKFGTTNPVELTLVSSAHHIELNPSDAGIRDREVVQEVIKEIAQSAPVIRASEGAAAAGASSATSAPAAFKVVVLNEVERLSKPAQHALRRTMEKYVGTCRLLLCCVSTRRR